eukprot:15358692-Ditylum_brightwellii.AAC.2
MSVLQLGNPSFGTSGSNDSGPEGPGDSVGHPGSDLEAPPGRPLGPDGPDGPEDARVVMRQEDVEIIHVIAMHSVASETAVSNLPAA